MARLKVKVKIEQEPQANGFAIDYDKLGESVAVAVTAALAAEEKKHSDAREWMKWLLSPLMWLYIVFSAGCSLLLCVFSVKAFLDFAELDYLAGSVWIVVLTGLKPIILFAAGLFFGGTAFFTFFVSKELDKESSIERVSAVFSGAVALAALLISVLSFIKGVA